MKTTTVLAIALGLGSLAACNKSPQEQTADNIEANAENTADTIEANADNMHPGIDLAGSYGTPVYATADGTVLRAGWNNGGYGNLVEVDHGIFPVLDVQAVG